MSGIPDKIKFIIVPSEMIVPVAAPETLLITTHFTNEAFQNLILEILNKRWRTLDLVSMMKELNRSWSERFKMRMEITDKLSSLPRFEKEKDLTD